MKQQQAWIVAVDMGYGHQRAAYPLRHLSPTGSVIIANNYDGISGHEFRAWQNSRRVYEFFSRLNQLPGVGPYLFALFDKFQEVPEFYPRRDLSAPNLQVRQNYYLVRHGLGKNLVRLLNQQDIPLITTFFTAAFMAEEHAFKNDIYLVICDADVSRTWAPLHPRRSRIKYLAPCRRVVERLRLYGVKQENIFLTGFPLPEENIGATDGARKLNLLHNDLAERLINLDPERRFRQKYGSTAQQFLKSISLSSRHRHPLTLTFAVGGAGAQRELARDILTSCRGAITRGEMNVNLVAGTRSDVSRFFHDEIKRLKLQSYLGDGLRIIFAIAKEEYFTLFNDALRRTDIVWTKPSELVFYSALGLPIVMAPSLGSQEKFNRIWLKSIGAGLSQNDPRYAAQWLTDWINSGVLAEAALAGYLDGRQFGVRNMMDVVFHGVKEPAKDFQLL